MDQAALAAEGTEIIAQRVFSVLYIYLDTGFLILLCTLLFLKKKYMTLLFALAGGILYMIVDYGIFHLALHTRSIEGGNMFRVLLWMSMSYGITNFAWLWLAFSKDRHLTEWSVLICAWWIAAPMIASSFGASFGTVTIQRTTGAYHGYMALILFASYAAAAVYNLFQKEREARLPILRILAAGILVQFAWEFSLLIGGIRSAAILDWGAKLTTLVVNSLLETNLGAVPIFVIYTALSARFTENLSRRKGISFSARLGELNRPA